MMATARVSDRFIAVAILLLIKGQGAMRGSLQFSFCCKEEIEVPLADHDGNTTQREGFVVSALAIFAGPQEEEDGYPCKVHDGVLERC